MDAFSPQVAVDSNGNAIFVWGESDPVTGSTRIQTRLRLAGGTLTAPQTLDTESSGGDISNPQLAVDANGNAVYTWAHHFIGGSGQRIETRVRAANGTLTAIQPLSTLGDKATLPQVDVDASGNASYVWRDDLTYSRIQARSRSSTGTLGAIQTLSVNGHDADDPHIAVAASGPAFADWQRFDGSTSCSPSPDGCLRIQASFGP
jgi:hypothetical protein